MSAVTPGPGTLRIALTSVFGDPLEASTWSGAPANLANELRALGADVLSIHPRSTRGHDLWDALQHFIGLGGAPLNREATMRIPSARARRALAVSQAALRLGVDRVLHTGTLDMPADASDRAVRHYLYCDHTWDLAKRYAVRGRQRSAGRAEPFEELERSAYAACQHIFTFGGYVRDNLVDHYGISPDRVTVVGSGMGRIRPYDGPKDYAHGAMLFIAKHLFTEKGGQLALKAFRIARRRRPDLRLIVVGNDRWRSLVGAEPGVHVVGHVPWDALEELLRSAALLLQPMFNDPWGQVYLEALASRTPVIGLDRNGLPEITDGGRHGFLVPVADPVVLAETIIDAMADPDRLAAMGESGQRHVLSRYSWRRVADSISRTFTTQ
ncbi:glycosyltransferase family 4 protein [Thalassobaculum sp.]